MTVMLTNSTCYTIITIAFNINAAKLAQKY